jgi:radical SAM modification target selenobiotic family peptide
MMDTKQLKKILGTLGLAGLLATANLALPGCEKQPAGEQSS